LSHLLHIDSSIHLDGSVSRALTERAARMWRDAHPGGTVTYRDLGSTTSARPARSRPRPTTWSRPASRSIRIATKAYWVAGDVNPGMSQFIPLAHASRVSAEREIDSLWRPAALAA
jgi:hypothetical protein